MYSRRNLFRVTSSLAFAVLLTALMLPSVVQAAGDANNLVRISVTSKAEAKLLPRSLDIPGHKPGEWVDAVVTEEQIEDLRSRGLFVQLLSKDVSQLLRDVQPYYPTWSEFQTDLHTIVNSYPSLCTLDTLGYTYEGRPIQVVKLSDLVGIDEDEPEVLYTGLTHAREWPSLVVCMFILDSLTSAYGVDPSVTNMVDEREIYIIPCLNPDGYVYSHDLGHDWRKNRRPFPEFGTVGVDLNRNYAGSTDGHREGEWGTTIGSVTHDPGDDLYCGPMPFSEVETSLERDFMNSRDFCAGLTFHTYSELVLWPWAYGTYTVPNESFLSNLGIGVANLITQEDYTGTYTPQSSSSLYPTSGDATDWVYGYSHYVKGADCPFYTVEIGQQFQPPSVHLDQIARENFDGAFYLLQQAATVRATLIPRVIPPVVAPFTGPQPSSYAVEWSSADAEAMLTAWEIEELSDMSVATEGAEGSTALWNLEGFTVSSNRAHTGSKSFKSSQQNERSDAVTSVNPYYVEPDDSLKFWTWYDIEEGWDYGYVELSMDGREYFVLGTFTGSSGGWVEKTYSLEDYEGKSVFFRFRYTTDSYVLEEGYYVDDIYPTVSYTATTLSSTVADTFYTVSNQPTGTYYHRVRGNNAEWGWCDFSTLSKVTVQDQNAGSIAGTVLDSVSGLPLSDINVEVLNGMVVVGSDMSSVGDYLIGGIAAGTYDVRASGDYFETKIVYGIQVEAQQTETLDFELAANWGVISGTVTDSLSGSPISGALVELYESSIPIKSVTSSPDGSFDIDTVFSGTYSLRTSAADHLTRVLQDVPVAARGTTYVDVRMMPTAICGDANGSGGVDIDDAVFLISYIFSGGSEPDPYWVGDVDCSGSIDIDDAVYMIAYIFSGGPEPCADC